MIPQKEGKEKTFLIFGYFLGLFGKKVGLRKDQKIDQTIPRRKAWEEKDDRKDHLSHDKELDQTLAVQIWKPHDIQKEDAHHQHRQENRSRHTTGKKAGLFPVVKGRHEHGKDVQRANRQQSAKNTVRRRANKGNYFFHGGSSFAFFCISTKNRLFIPK